jgi:hypothetical protein
MNKERWLCRHCINQIECIIMEYRDFLRELIREIRVNLPTNIKLRAINIRKRTQNKP